MRWKRVSGERVQPNRGTYRNWKTQVANDCGGQCIYCAIHESRFGGLANFHVEHHRPKSNPRFAHLKDVITNLYLACAICNWFKGNDWPNDPVNDHSVVGYPDPASTDYNDLFTIGADTYLVVGIFPASKYVTERLYLNRPQLILERRSWAIEYRLGQFEHFALDAAKVLEGRGEKQATRLIAQLLKIVVDLNQQFRDANRVRPYELAEIRR